MRRVQDDRVQAHAHGPRRPPASGLLGPQPGQLRPGRTAVSGLEQAVALDSGIYGVRVVERWLEVPDASELPRVRRAVVPLVRARGAVIAEFAAHRLPRLPT